MLVVDVEPVEGVAHLRHRQLEVVRPVDQVRVVDVLEADRRVHLVEVGGAVGDVRDGLALDRRATGDEPQRRALHRERLAARRGRVGQVGRPAVGARERLHLLAGTPVEEVVRVDGGLAAVRVAERQRPGVGDVLPGRRRAPRVVAPAPQLHVHVRAGE